jgi:elongation factor Ts
LSDFTVGDVQKLREKTGCGMMDCKKALTVAKGDFNLAVDNLRETKSNLVLKKSGRVTSQGLTFSASRRDCGAIVEVNCETDFVANTGEFREFVELCLEVILNNEVENENDVGEILKIKTSSGNLLEDILNDKISKVGENIRIRRFYKFRGLTSSYIHAKGKIAVLVGFSGDLPLADNQDFKVMSRDVAMHVAAAAPSYLNAGIIGDSVISHERDTYRSQAIREEKPENVIQRIVENKIRKFYEDNCLLEQPLIKDPSVNIKNYVYNFAKSVNTFLNIDFFKRYVCGETID